MKEALQISMFILMLSFGLSIEKIPNGIYKVLFDERFSHYEDYRIKINDTTYVKYFSSGDSIQGNLKWVYDRTLLFVLNEKVSTDSMTDFQKIMAKSGPTILIFNNTKGDTLPFRTTYLAQLLVTINEGKFVRLK